MMMLELPIVLLPVASPSSVLDRRLEVLRSERSGVDRPPTPPDWRIPPMDRYAREIKDDWFDFHHIYQSSE